MTGSPDYFMGLGIKRELFNITSANINLIFGVGIYNVYWDLYGSEDLSEDFFNEFDTDANDYNDLMNDQTYLNNILSDGSNKASYKAKKTISKVYRKVGFVKSL